MLTSGKRRRYVIGAALIILRCNNATQAPNGDDAEQRNGDAGESVGGSSGQLGTGGLGNTTGGVTGSMNPGGTGGGGANAGAAGNSGSALGGNAGSTNSGGTNDGGATDGGMTDAGATDSGATVSCLPSYLLCEDFENTAPGMTPPGWTAHGMASVAAGEAHSGQHALKVSPTDNGERRIYHDASMLGAQHWGRVYYKVQLPIPDAFVHSTLVALNGTGPTVGDAEFRFVDTVNDQKTGGFAMGRHQFLFNVQPNGPEFGMGTNYDYTFDGQWHCAEWHVDAADQSYHFYYDSQDVLNFTHGAGNFQDSDLPNGFGEVRVGWNNYQSAPPGFTAWIDDFALADERIHCLP
jgi:hypothetical protein